MLTLDQDQACWVKIEFVHLGIRSELVGVTWLSSRVTSQSGYTIKSSNILRHNGRCWSETRCTPTPYGSRGRANWPEYQDKTTCSVFESNS